MITKEKLEHHISHLEEQHRELDKEITEMDCHWDESPECHDLKKKRLRIKDEIESCKRKIVELT
jgi:uncharacterized protein YdcH (DUF465 family)